MNLTAKKKQKIQAALGEIRRRNPSGLCWVCQSIHGVKAGREGYGTCCGECIKANKTTPDVEAYNRLKSLLEPPSAAPQTNTRRPCDGCNQQAPTGKEFCSGCAKQLRAAWRELTRQKGYVRRQGGEYWVWVQGRLVGSGERSKGLAVLRAGLI